MQMHNSETNEEGPKKKKKKKRFRSR